MPAEVTITNGRAELAYTGAKPWHGLGTYVDHLMTSKEAIVAGQLDWAVVKMPLYTNGARNGPTATTGFFGVFREDTGKCFAAGFGKQYTPLQNVDAFAFMDSVIGEHLATYEVVGSLFQGKRIFLLAKLPESIKVAGKDLVDQYLLLANSHDGSLAVTIQWTPIRVVCNNTLSAALTGSGKRIRHRHTVNLNATVQDTRRLLGLSQEYFQEWTEQATRLVATQVTPAQELEVLGQVFQITPERVAALAADGGAHKGREQALFDCLTLAHYGQGNEDYAGTAWGLLNGVTEWIDHYRPSRKEGMDANEYRLNSSWFGGTAEIRDRTWQLLAAVK